MLQVMPCSASSRWNCLALCIGCPGPSDAAARSALPRRQIAMISASVTNCAVICGCIGPADDPAREQVQHDRQVQPALGRPDVGEVGHPALVRRRRLELPIQHVRCDRAPAARPRPRAADAAGGAPCRPARASGARRDGGRSVSPVAQIAPHARTAVGAVALLEAGADLRQQLLDRPGGRLGGRSATRRTRPARHRAPRTITAPAISLGASR